MDIRRFVAVILLGIVAVTPAVAFAQSGVPDVAAPPVPEIQVSQPDEFSVGRVEDFLSAGGGTEGKSVHIRIENGTDAGKVITLEYPTAVESDPTLAVKVGERLVVVKSYAQGAAGEYFIADKYRTPEVGILIAIFFGLAIFFGRRKGATSILGLLFTLAVIMWFVVPRIAGGSSPLPVILASSIVIMVASLYLAHGFNRRTSLALAGSAITLVIALALAVGAVSLAKIFGMGSEESFFLQTDLANINLKGLLLGGIVIGVLGVLDDITTAQVAVVAELKDANRSLRFGELYKRGLVVGREHIASLVNTLVLAYAGASLPIFLLFRLNQSQPWWVIANSEFIVEEVVRTLVGSAALILAVPITTLIAAKYFSKHKVDLAPEDSALVS
jgi:uncharacterized membrane protein